MKKLKKFLKIFLILVVSLVILVYGGVFLGHKVLFPMKTSDVPTIQGVADGTFTFGPQARAAQPATMDEFIPILARQLKHYNEIAPDLWPDNALVDQALVVEGLKSKKFWYIAPDGAATPISKNEALRYGIQRQAYVNGFSAFDGGFYLAVTEEHLANYLMWQKYLHFGMHDAFLFFTHEGFHMREQAEPKWRSPDVVANQGRNEFLDDIPARAKRELLQKQLLQAVSAPDDTQLILDALATYEDWKTQFPDEYKNALYFERIEGPANYFELVTGLYCGYPEQVKNADDLDRALALLATRGDVYVRYGLVSECYTVGGFACVLLDRLEGDWKQGLTDDPEATPMELLARHFKDETLPEPRQLAQAEIDAVGVEIQKPEENRGTPLLFKMLYDMLF